jgi:hypothetical protein
METFLSIIEYTHTHTHIISWSFGMEKTLISPYILGFALWRWSIFYFWVYTTYFLVEHSIHFISYKFTHGVGYLGIHTCGLVVSMHSWRVHFM